jgi:hypothetical protein
VSAPDERRRRRPWSCGVGLLVTTVFCVGTAAAAAPRLDRLDRFRELAATRLSLAQVIDADAAAYRDAYGLLDEEIVESLNSGGVFASLAFLQERLEAFAEAWGAAMLEIRRIGPLVVGAFKLGEGSGGTSLRVYGRLRDEAALLDVLDRGGRPRVFPLAPTPRGPVQFLVAWEGSGSGRGTRAFRVDLVRHHGDGVRTIWTTADVIPEGLQVKTWSIRGTDVRVRYEARYPGWTPGCEPQTETEDVYRLAADGSTFTRTGRQTFNAWHRELRSTVAALFAALASGDRAALTTAVPDTRLRSRLPATLRPESACDAPEGPGPDAVSVAASVADGRPWTLTFRRAGPRWRLTAAEPVLQ